MRSLLVSIIIPTYNRAHLIGETLDSVLAQTYTNWECIVVDDGSTDGTEVLMKTYCDKDSRFQYHHRPAGRLPGGNAARNYGFEFSKGEYVKWFDSDDIMHPNFISKQYLILSEKPSLDFCACQWEYFDDVGQIKKVYINLKPQNESIYSYFLEGHVFLTHAPLWRKSFLINCELFDEKLKRGQETDFHFRILTKNPKYLIHEDFLFQVRRNHKSIESTSNNIVPQESVLIYFKKVFFILKEIDFDKKEVVRSYIWYRCVNQIGILMSKQKSILGRWKYFRGLNQFYSKRTDFYIIYLFLFVALITNRGYYFYSLKKYDLRKNK
ncbi:glycosyltransferase family 2 protein [Subsaximicrobium wynnwilliamsii]|uniref:glycosyltransferase family 2 protein n=1 Tax=Subsaximicrobium wynnwilliamsii TaxID=291179 RepID=UPI0016728378|nr:glycosyltransferase family 2 protein [Subsaximicrobium wynnwilliamsii]